MNTHTHIVNSKKIYLDKNLQILFGVTIMSAVGIFSVSPAFPRIVRELQISSRDVGLLIAIFTFPGILLMPVMGILADLFGRKKVLVPSLMVFGVAGGACFWVYDFTLLLVLRFFQGMGAAPLSSLNIAVIGDLYSGKRRTEALGYNQSIFSIGAASLTALGGVLATIGWYYPFLLPLIAIPVGLLVMISLKSHEPRSTKDVKEYTVNAWRTIRNRQIFLIYTATIVTFIFMSGAYLTYFPLFLGFDFNVPPLLIGLIMSSMTVASAFSSSQIGKIVQVFSEKTIFAAGFILYASALMIIPFIPNTWLFFIPATIFGFAQGTNIPIIQTLLGNISPAENRGIIMSLNGTAIRLGQTIGPVLMGTAYTLWGMHGVFYFGACLSIIMSGLIFILVKQRDFTE